MRKFLARFRQAPVFSTVYVLGAALSVASVMLVAIFLHVKTSNIYPEYSRDDMLYLDLIEFRFMPNDSLIDPRDEGPLSEWGISGGLAPEMIAMLRDTLSSQCYVGASAEVKNPVSVYVDRKRFDNVAMREFDAGMFEVYNYKFLEGKPFTREDFETHAPKVVISDRLARRLFGTDRDIVGREIMTSAKHVGYFGKINNDEALLKVCGVFEEGSRLLPQSFAELIVPSLNEEAANTVDLVGSNRMVLLPKSGVSKEQVAETIRTFLNKYMSSTPLTVNAFTRRTVERDENGNIKSVHTYSSSSPLFQTTMVPGQYTINTGTYPRGSLQMVLGDPGNLNEEFDLVGFTKLYGVLALVLLLVPALNLSSLISGNMDSKMSEIGIRKAFGARNSTLLRQVVNENLWLTGCGALLGVILAWIGVVMWKEWLFAGVGSTGGELSTSEIILDPAMLFAPKVFIAAVVICVVLNLLSSLIPVMWSLRRPAIDAIKAKS